MRTTQKNKQFHPAVSLDVSQALDRVWIEALHQNMSTYRPTHHTLLLELYLKNRLYQTNYGGVKQILEFRKTAY